MSMNAELIRIFRVVVQQGSMTKAAPLLNMTQSLVSKSMTKLEHQSKNQLLIRTKHGITVTDMGAKLMDFSNKLHESMEIFEKDFMEDRNKIEGVINIVAFPYLGSEWFIKASKGFSDINPKIRFSITLKEDNILPSNFDVGIGGFIPNQPHLIQRELFPDYNRIYASKEYLQKHGTPLDLKDLNNHNLIVYGGKNSYSSVRSTNLLMNLGLSPGSFPREPRVQVNSLSGMINGVLAGVGIAELPMFAAVHYPELVQILPEVTGENLPIYFICHENRKSSKKIQALYEYLYEKSKEERDVI